MRRFHNQLLNAIANSHLNSPDLIPVVEDLIGMTRTNLEANKLIKDEMAILKNEYTITQATILLSLLRMHSGPLP
jgi:hypothetical protein